MTVRAGVSERRLPATLAWWKDWSTICTAGHATLRVSRRTLYRRTRLAHQILEEVHCEGSPSAIFIARNVTLARYMLPPCVSVCLSVCLSVTSWCSTETAKRRIAQTTPHASPMQGLQFSDAENLGKTHTGSPPTEAPHAGELG